VIHCQQGAERPVWRWDQLAMLWRAGAGLMPFVANGFEAAIEAEPVASCAEFHKASQTPKGLLRGPSVEQGREIELLHQAASLALRRFQPSTPTPIPRSAKVPGSGTKSGGTTGGLGGWMFGSFRAVPYWNEMFPRSVRSSR
jgi:hypothetical protein